MHMTYHNIVDESQRIAPAGFVLEEDDCLNSRRSYMI